MAFWRREYQPETNGFAPSRPKNFVEPGYWKPQNRACRFIPGCQADSPSVVPRWRLRGFHFELSCELHSQIRAQLSRASGVWGQPNTADASLIACRTTIPRCSADEVAVVKRIYAIELLFSHSYRPLSIPFKLQPNSSDAKEKFEKEIAVGCRSPPIGEHPRGSFRPKLRACVECLQVSHTAGKEGLHVIAEGSPQAYVPHHGVAKHRLEVAQTLFLLHVRLLLTFSFWLVHRYGASVNLKNADLASPRGGASDDFRPEGTMEAMGPVDNQTSRPSSLIQPLSYLSSLC